MVSPLNFVQDFMKRMKYIIILCHHLFELLKIDVFAFIHRYMGATAVQKDLVILLDGGNSMGDYLPNDIFQSRDFTKFIASVNMIDELLDTLTYGDRVSVISFSSSTKANMVYKTVKSSNPTHLLNLEKHLLIQYVHFKRK